MRFNSLLLTAAAVLSVCACRLDLKGDSSDEGSVRDSADARSPAEVDDDARDAPSATDTGGRAPVAPVAKAEGKDDADSSLSCATAAILDIAQEYKDNIKHLSGAYHVTGHPALTGDVTIDPGTVLIFGADSSLEIGRNNTRTTLTALGTSAAPIRFCSDEPIRGHWQGLILSGGLTTDSRLQHLHVYDGGAGNVAALQVSAPIQLTDVYVHSSLFDGVSASNFGQGSSGLTIENVQGSAMVLTAQAALANLPTEIAFGENSDNTVHILFPEYRGGSLRLPNLGVPYVQDRDMVLYETTFDIDPGVEYVFAADTGLDIGWNSSDALFRANGTVAAPIIFRGLTNKKGSWKGVGIERNVSTDSILLNVQLLNGGKGAPPLAVRSGITLSDVQITDCAQSPEISAILSEASANLSVTGSDSFALVSAINYLTGLPRGGKFTGNADDVIQLSLPSPSYSLGKASIPNLGVPYFVTGDILIGEGSDVTLEPGVEFVVESGHQYGFIVGWNSSKATIVADGTPDAPIIFRGEKDDVGAWKGVDVGARVSTDSLFNYVQVQNAGLSTNSQITITNSTFSKSSGFGILKARADMTDYAATNTFVGNVMGDVGMH